MKDKKTLTIRDIAGVAGVSPATVSLVLNGKGDISGVTRARVLEAVASLNYVPRSTKNGIEAGDTLRFLKIAKHGHTVNRDHSVFISDYIDGMSAEATRRNYTLEVVSFESQPISTVAESLADYQVSRMLSRAWRAGVTTIFPMWPARCISRNASPMWAPSNTRCGSGENSPLAKRSTTSANNCCVSDLCAPINWSMSTPK